MAGYGFYEVLYQVLFEKMGNSLGSFIPKGASTLVDDYGKKIVQNFGKEKLRSIAKLNFKNTEKILNEN